MRLLSPTRDLIDTRTGNIVGRCKHEDNIRRAYNTQFDKVLSSLHWKNTLFITATLDGVVTFERMRLAVTCFIKWIKKLCGFKFGAYFIEPHADGNWHVHFLIYFKPLVPEGCEDAIIAWWDARNGRPCDEQVEIEAIEDSEHLLNILRYLKPTRSEKQSRIKYYLLSTQPFGCFGEVLKPDRSLEIFEDVQPSLDGEFISARSRFEIYIPETDELLSYSAEFFFEANLAEIAKPADLSLGAQVAKTELHNSHFYSRYADRTSGFEDGDCDHCINQYTFFCDACVYYEGESAVPDFAPDVLLDYLGYVRQWWAI